MNHCDFIRAGSWIECKWCGTKIKIPRSVDEKAILHPCVKAPDFHRCIHKGSALGQVKVACKSCGGMHWAYECDLHKRCLPTFRGPWGESQQEHEAKVYTLCNGCEDFVDRGELVEIQADFSPPSPPQG